MNGLDQGWLDAITIRVVGEEQWERINQIGKFMAREQVLGVLNAAEFGKVLAERDRLRSQLAFVLGEFDEDRYNGASLGAWSGYLSAEEMETARAALEVDCE